MTNIILSVSGQKLSVSHDSPVVSGGVNNLRFIVTCSGSWNKAEHIYAHFSNGKEKYDAEVINHKVTGIDLSAGTWSICLHGELLSEEIPIFRVTSSTAYLNVLQGGKI